MIIYILNSKHFPNLGYTKEYFYSTGVLVDWRNYCSIRLKYDIHNVKDLLEVDAILSSYNDG